MKSRFSLLTLIKAFSRCRSEESQTGRRRIDFYKTEDEKIHLLWSNLDFWKLAVDFLQDVLTLWRKIADNLFKRPGWYWPDRGRGHLTPLPPKWPKCLWPPGSPRPPWPPGPLELPNQLITSSGKNASGHSACFSGRSGQQTACWGNTSHVNHCQPKVWVHIFEPYLTVLFHF